MKKKIYTIKSASFAICIIGMFSAVSVNAQTISTYAGNGTSGYTGDGAAATSAKLSSPGSSCADAAGNLYIADKNNHVIRKVGTDGVISTIVGTGTAGNTGDGGPANAATISAPLSVKVDAAGNLFIADFGNSRIRKVTPAGIISTVAGTTNGFAGDGGAATAAQINNPTDVGVDAAGNIYICDYGNNKIRKVTTTGIISTLAGSTAGFSGDGGPATAAEFNSPNGIHVDASGNVLVADLNNNRVREVSTSGMIQTIAGNDTAGYSGDGGAATAAKLRRPAFITKDSVGNIFFSDLSNHVVRRISTTGIITTIAGNNAAGSGYTGDGGPATEAQLNQPTGVNFDAMGNFYITVQGSHAVRKITPPSTAVNNTIAMPKSTVSIYPNPANQIVNIAGIVTGSSVTIIDAVGKVVYQATAQSSHITIGTAHLSAGTYIVKVTGSNNATTTQKLLLNN